MGTVLKNMSITMGQNSGISENHIIIKLNVTKNFREERIEGKRAVCLQRYEGFSVGKVNTFSEVF